MDTKHSMACAGFAGEQGDIEWTVYLKGGRVDLTWRRETENGPDLIELPMSIDDLKRLALAAQWILEMTGNATPLLSDRPISGIAGEE